MTEIVLARLVTRTDEIREGLEHERAAIHARHIRNEIAELLGA